MKTIKRLYHAVKWFYSYERMQINQDFSVVMDNIRDYHDIETSTFIQLRSE